MYPNLYLDSNYYDINGFRALELNDRRDFCMLHLNSRSLLPKIDNLQGYLQGLGTKFDVMCFTETWLTMDTKDLANFTGYTAFHNLRSGRRGGGVSIYVDSKYSATILDCCTLSDTSIESIFLSVTIDSKSCTIGTIYRPPQTNSTAFNDNFLLILSRLTREQSNDITIAGDFNCDLLGDSSSSFLDLIHSSSLLPLIHAPTRIVENSASLIDNFLMTTPHNTTSGVLTCDLSDHFPIFVVRHQYLNSSNIQRDSITWKYRVIKDENIQNLQGLLTSRLHNFTFNDDFNTSVNDLADLIHECYLLACPLKSSIISNRQLKKPWISRSLSILIKRRETFFIAYKNGRMSRSTYCNFRNYVTNLIRSSKNSYYHDKFRQFKTNSRKTWSTINKVLGKDFERSQSTPPLKINDSVITSNIDIANHLNHYFANIGNIISANSDNNNHNFNEFLIDSYPNSFYLSPTSPQEVNKIILSLRNKSSNSTSVMPTKVLKSIAHIISAPISYLINRSYSLGIFPDLFKLAKIIPIHKGGDKSDRNNYRPIAILMDLCKIFEKTIYSRMYRFAKKFNIFNPCQYGFQKDTSTSHALLDQLQYIYDSLDDGNYVFSLFLDFRKAFDCIDHNILLQKLYHYGYRGPIHRLLQSYLSNRYQYTVVNGQTSSNRLITHGVPQGSNLGPLLFLFFINDLPNFSTLFKFIMFADDCTISTNIPHNCNLPHFMELINSELKSLFNWTNANKLSLNMNKTHFIVFSYRMEPTLPPVMLGNCEVDRVQKTRFLGVVLDERVSFKPHIDSIAAKLSKTVGILHRIKYLLPPSILRLIYNSFALPHISYGIEIWYSAYKNSTDRIFILQKKAVRAVDNLPYNTHTSSSFKSLNILKLQDLYNLRLSCAVYNSAENHGYGHFSEKLISFTHQHDTRNMATFRLPRYNRAKSQRSPLYVGIKLFNAYPQSYRLQSINNFKNTIKRQIISNYY